MSAIWLQQVQRLDGPGSPLQTDDALIGGDGRLEALGEEAHQRAMALGLSPRPSSDWILAPVLVDPHSVLEEPWGGRADTLESLAGAAARGGYGTVALLPWGRPWRDHPELLDLRWPEPLCLLVWGSFSASGEDRELAPHADQLAAGAVGLAGGSDCPPLPLLERGVLLGENGTRPLLLAPRDSGLTSGGFVREGVEALRAGWPPDPLVSETLPLLPLLALAATPAGGALSLMNLSTAAGVAALRQAECRPAATVSWWHLVADAASLAPGSDGWRVEPSLGSPADREALIAALAEGLLTAVAVHHRALDPEELLLPLDQRRAGVAGHRGDHGLVLPALWQELVVARGWTASQLWQALSWGPAALLGLPAEHLHPGSRRWLLFDPGADQPVGTAPRLWEGSGAVRATGLTDASSWWLDRPTPGAAACRTD